MCGWPGRRVCCRLSQLLESQIHQLEQVRLTQLAPISFPFAPIAKLVTSRLLDGIAAGWQEEAASCTMEAGVNPSAPSRSRSRRMMVLDGCFALSRSGTRERDMRLRKKETEISSASTASKAARAGGGAGRSSGQLVAVEVSTSRPIKQQQRQEQQRERQRTVSLSPYRI